MKGFFNLQRFQDIYIGTGVVHSVVSGTSKNDSIRNEGNMITIKAGAGNDTVYNYNAQLAVTYMGDGNDSVYNDESNNGKISLGAGNDTAYIDSSSNVTLSGGDGNDSVYSDSSNKISISGGAGNDTIMNYNYQSNSPISTINAGKGDDIVSLSSYSYYNKNIVQYTQGDGYDVIYGFGSYDTLKVTGKTVSTMSSGSDMYVTVGEGTIVLKDAADEISKKNIVTVKGGSSSGGSSGSKNKWTVSGTTASYGTSSKTLVKIFGLKSGLTASGGKISGISLNNKVVTVAASVLANNKAVSVSGAGYKFNITGTQGANTIIGGSGADTLSGGKGTDYLTGGNGADIFVHSGGNDIIKDYISGEDKIKFANATSVSTAIENSAVVGTDVILTTSSGKITIKGAANQEITFLNKNNKATTDTYADDSGDDNLGDGLSLSDDGTAIVADSTFTQEEINLSNYGDGVTGIDASGASQAVYLVGNGKANSLVGSSKDDTLEGGAGNDTLKGGSGSNIFAHSAGNDVITDYKAKDTIYLIDTAITGFSFRIQDVILSTDNGSINIKGGKDKKITVVDSSGITTTKTYGVLSNGLKYDNNNTILKASKSFTGDTIDLADYLTTVKTVDASAVTNNIEIVGNKLNNSLVGGKGSDTINGGAGNDTLTGNGGRDTFVYTGGDDIITDYTAGKDKVKLSGTTLKDVSVGNNNIVFTTSTGILTLKGTAGKSVTIIDKDGKEITQRYSANIAEILADNSIGEFENYTEKLTQESLITFAK